MIVSVETGKWSRSSTRKDQSEETFSGLNARIEKLREDLIQKIKSAMTQKTNVRISNKVYFDEYFTTIIKELRKHEHKITKFAHKAPSLEFENVRHTLSTFIIVMEKVTQSWNHLLNATQDLNEERLGITLKKVHYDLKTIEKIPNFAALTDAFYYLDDAARGLLYAAPNLRVSYKSTDAVNKFTDCALRLMAKAWSNIDEEIGRIDICFIKAECLVGESADHQQIAALKQLKSQLQFDKNFCLEGLY